MEQFIGTKVINARLALRSEVDSLIGNESSNNDEGYLVEYLDGGKPNTKEFDNYISWSPKDVFEKAYKASGSLSFGDAITYMKQGQEARLPYWAKDVFLSIQNTTEASKMTAPYIYVTSRFGKVPWVATQIEMLAEDWEIVQ